MRSGTDGWGWLNSIAARYLLPAWFALFAAYHVVHITQTGAAGLDARIYHRAAVAWLAGGDPWAASVTISAGPTYHFAGLPPTVLVFAPFAWLPEAIIQWGWVAGSIAAGAWIIRRLEVPWWWLLFPPLVMGAWSGNPGVVLLALLLSRWPPAQGLAAALKVYALLPMLAERRWRGLAVFAGLCLVSLPLWLTWDPFGTTGRLISEAAGGFGATAYWWLIPPTLLALALIARVDLRAATYLAIPALWPSAQYHYAVMALPFIGPLEAFLFAVPMPGIAAAGVVAHAWLRLRAQKDSREAEDGASLGARAGRTGVHDHLDPVSGDQIRDRARL